MTIIIKYTKFNKKGKSNWTINPSYTIIIAVNYNLIPLLIGL